jgi:hypothetical protein
MAGSGIPRMPGSFAAAADYATTDNRHKAVYLSDDFEITVASAATDPVIGILENKPDEGEAAEVTMFGETEGKAADAITAGNFLVADSAGDLVPITVTDEGTVNYYVGRALQDAVDNDIFKLLVCPGYICVA